MLKSKKVKRIIIALCIVALVLFIALPLGLSIYIYESNFGNRFTTTSWLARSMDEFEGLKTKRYTFKSNKGQQLVGYVYHKDNTNPKGMIIIAHGLGGGGHNSYMDIADYFASNDYLVFAYDVTGNDESEGSAVNGIPQGVIDLDYAVRFIKDTPEYNSLPIMLFGHSWGAYSVGSVLNVHPDVRAAVMIAGFNGSADVIKEQGEKITGTSMRYFMPYISLIERVKFGKYAQYTCMDGFDNSDANIMIIHSSDDNTISYQNQFLLFKESYESNPRFSFISFENRGHDYVYYSDASQVYKDKIYSGFKEYANLAEKGQTDEIKAAYMNKNLDKSMLFDLDLDLMETILRFYNSSTK